MVRFSKPPTVREQIQNGAPLAATSSSVRVLGILPSIRNTSLASKTPKLEPLQKDRPLYENDDTEDF